MVVSHKWERIKEFLDRNLNSVTVDGCKDIMELENKTSQTFLRCDVLLMRDDAFIDSKTNIKDYSITGSLIYTILKREYFEANKIIAMVSEDNIEILDLLKGINTSEDIKTEIDIMSKKSFTMNTVKQIVLENSNVFENEEPEYLYVVKTARGKEIDRNKLHTTEEVPMKVVLQGSNYDIQNIKESTKDIYKGKKLREINKYNKDLDNTDEEIADSDIAVSTESVKEVEHRCKTYLLTGEPKSGTSTMALIAGATASQRYKTLLIDMNWNNLGLSFLVEKTLIDYEINSMNISDYIAGGNIEKIKTDMYNKAQLHILNLSLPIKSVFTRYDYGYIINIILNYAKDVYDYILIDSSIYELKDYPKLLSNLDRIYITTPPYMNNIVSIMTAIKKSNLVNLKLFTDLNNNGNLENVTLIRTAVYTTVNKNIKVIGKPIIDRYSEEAFGNRLEVSAVYVYKGNTYLDTPLFTQLFENHKTEVSR